jgi:CPA2 family monovalent cation:H+ antiporter-2
LFVALDWLEPGTSQAERLAQPSVSVKDHIILVGYGRVGAIVGSALRDMNQTLVVIEDNADIVVRIRAEGLSAILGNAEAIGVLESARVVDARLLITAIPNVFEASHIIERARSVNSPIEIVARAHSDAEVEYLKGHGADVVIMGEQELARRMIEHALERI